MSNRFSYIRYNEESVAKQEAFKAMFEAIEGYTDKNLMEGRAKSLLLTALEEAYMWSGKAIRDEQMMPKLYTNAAQGLASCEKPSAQHIPSRG